MERKIPWAYQVLQEGFRPPETGRVAGYAKVSSSQAELTSCRKASRGCQRKIIESVLSREDSTTSCPLGLLRLAAPLGRRSPDDAEHEHGKARHRYQPE